MRLLNCTKTSIVLVGFIAAIVLCGGLAKADFTVGTPTNLGPVVNSSSYDAVPFITDDGLGLFFVSDRPGGYGGKDLWVTTRATTSDPWEEPVNLGPTVNSSSNDGAPDISADGLTLFFHSDRTGGSGQSDLWVTTWNTTDDDWGEPVNLGPTVNSSQWEYGPNSSANGLSLFFASNRSGGSGGQDLWVTTRATTQDDWGSPVNLGPTINSSYNDLGADISAEGLSLFFHSDRPAGYGDRDLWVSTRPTKDDEWGTPVNLGQTVNSSQREFGPNSSADGLSLFFASNRSGGSGGYDLWQASISPVVDLNGDGIVDSADMCIIVDNWGTDEPLCDIGPMPWGDGIVDVQDLIILAEHLFEEVPLVE